MTTKISRETESRPSWSDTCSTVTGFFNNLKSLKLEEQLASKIEKRLEGMTRWVDPRLFDRSLEVLASCRRTLMNTYAFAYYLKKNNQKEIFEVN